MVQTDAIKQLENICSLLVHVLRRHEFLREFGHKLICGMGIIVKKGPDQWLELLSSLNIEDQCSRRKEQRRRLQEQALQSRGQKPVNREESNDNVGTILRNNFIYLKTDVADS